MCKQASNIKTTQFPQIVTDWPQGKARTGNVLNITKKEKWFIKKTYKEEIRKVSTQKLMVEPLTDTGQWRAPGLVHSKKALMTTTAKDTVTDSHLYPQMYDHSKLPYHCWKTWPVVQDWGGLSSHCPILQMNIQFWFYVQHVSVLHTMLLHHSNIKLLRLGDLLLYK